MVALFGGIILSMVASLIAWPIWGYNVAYCISLFGTVVVVFGVLAYVVFIDSKRRWPNVPTFDRFARVITFYR